MLVSKDQIGFIQRFFEDAASPTGYSIVYLVGDELKQYPCTKEYWDLHLDEEFILSLIHI